MKKIILLHCFPVPYRNYLFQLMHEEAIARGVNFEVLFFDKQDESRPNWIVNSEDIKYNHKFFKLNFKKGSVLHLNIDLLKYIRDIKPDIIISGGVWSSINSILLILFSNYNIIGWDETNRHDFGSKAKNFLFFKKLLVKRLKKIAVPGLESKFYYEELIGESAFRKKSIFDLPNLVNESIFENLIVAREVYKENLSSKYAFLDYSKKIVYWPARYIKDKGIEEFLSIIDIDILQDIQILLVGHGPLRESIRKIIGDKGLSNHVFMINSMPYEESIKFYAISDMLIMPSLSDSNPLSIIEAIHCSLPILISKNVGNLNEVLIEGENGYSFSPLNSFEVCSFTIKMFSNSRERLKVMGEASKRLAVKNFSSKLVVNNFFSKI